MNTEHRTRKDEGRSICRTLNKEQGRVKEEVFPEL